MGNTSSGQGEKRVWPHQELRPPPRLISELSTKQKLRPTENGVIMHNGGTISIRRQLHSKKLEAHEDESFNHIKGNFYGSEPDLRLTEQKENENGQNHGRYRISRSRKKYKAPSAPQNSQAERSSPDSYQIWDKKESSDSQPQRRLRLFRTRAETKRRIADENLSSLPPMSSLHRSLSTPHLEVEISEDERVKDRVKELKLEDILKQHVCSIVDIHNRFGRNDTDFQLCKTKVQGSVELMTSSREEENNLWDRSSHSRPPAPVRTFYFGMNTEDNSMNDPVVVEKFVEKFHNISQINTSHTVSSSSSESIDETALDEKGKGIYVHLRATLPRKQLDIPRFSPTTAWRLLSALESTPPLEDDSFPSDDRIPNIPLPLQISSHLDKSADSGISGDASPQHHDSTHNSQTAWTPQQDLEDTSSEGGLDSIPVSPESITKAKFSPRFSLSLPRDSRLKLYSQREKVDIIEPSGGHNFKKLKRSISGVLGKGNILREDVINIPDSQQLLDANWVLSRSVPSSLNQVHASLQKSMERDSPLTSQEQEMQDFFSSEQPSFLHLANGGHIMYLPSYTTPRGKSSTTMVLSKSCEDLTYNAANQHPDSFEERMPSVKRNSQKFTFQSTIRQLERKRIADKLSKQAETRERERLCEIEAMQRVEEEFQRKREREKADIRQQLRLYSIKHHERDKNDATEFPLQATQILSEFRQPHRNYRDFRPQRNAFPDGDSLSLGETTRKRETVHPEVVYKIPKSTQVYIAASSKPPYQTGNCLRAEYSPSAL